MADAYIGELRLFPFAWAPQGWAQCDGALLTIAQNSALYAILGTTYGGDGKVSFALPDLRGRVPIHQNPSGHPAYTMGQKVGAETHALSLPELPSHAHQLAASNTSATTNVVANGAWANTEGQNLYANAANSSMGNGLSENGSGQAHTNVQPSTVLNYCICVAGNFPPRP